LTAKKMDSALWTQAIAIAEGDAGKTQAAYIRLRLIDLKKSASSPTISPLEIENPKSESKPPEGGLAGVRSELSKKLQALGKTSLYTTLSLHPDASDAVVASAIEDFESRTRIGSVATTAEFKYAKETLGNPKSREQYDRKLLASILNSGTAQLRSYAYEPLDSEYSWWESRKTSVILGVFSLFLFGYLGLGFFKERGGFEVQNSAIEMQRDAVHTIADIDQQKTQAAIDMNNRNMEYRNRAAEQMQQQQYMQQSRIQDMQNMQIERQRLQQEQAEKIKAQREQQAESMQAQREQRYWACMNQQLSLPKATSADAYARCASLH
jgi:hypothetical protein